MDHIFDTEFLETMFGPNNVIKKEAFLEAFKSGTFKSKADLKWIFNLTKVRQKYQKYIDEGLGDQELENNEIR